jgi:hypothetical protein
MVNLCVAGDPAKRISHQRILGDRRYQAGIYDVVRD